MNIHKHNSDRLKKAFTGRIVARVYDEDGSLKRVHTADNIATTEGINMLTDMILDGYNQTYPKAYGDFNDPTWQKSALHNRNEFTVDGMPGEIFGVDVIDWPARHKSTFTRHGDYNHYVSNPDRMFNNYPYDYANFWHNAQWNQYWSPSADNSMQGGWIVDLGVTDVADEEFTAPDNTGYHNLQNKNLYYENIIVKSGDGSTVYEEGVDYEWDCGDGDTYGSIKLVNQNLIGQTLLVSYTWYDVPQVPIVGFALDAGSNTTSGWDSRTNFNAFNWSLNQGESRTYPFFPNNNGSPRHIGWQGYKWDWPWPAAWHAQDNTQLPLTYFFNSLPYAVKNPVQMGWFGQNYDHDKHIYNFELLTFNMPKLGIHAIGLGSGSGTPSSGDADLFHPEVKKITTSKGNNGIDTMTIKTIIDYNEANGILFTEAALFYPEDEYAYFKEDTFWSRSSAEGGAGTHSDYIKGSNKILKMTSLDPEDCSKMVSHAMYDEPWSKNESERIELTYELQITW